MESGSRREGEDASSSVSGDAKPERLACKPSLPNRMVRSCAVRGDAITRFVATDGDKDGLADEKGADMVGKRACHKRGMKGDGNDARGG